MEPTRKGSAGGRDFDLYFLTDGGEQGEEYNVIILKFDDQKTYYFRAIGHRSDFVRESFDDPEPKIRGYITGGMALKAGSDSLSLLRVHSVQGALKYLGINLDTVSYFRDTDIRPEFPDELPGVSSVGLLDLLKLKE
jgi:hypothetical protein